METAKYRISAEQIWSIADAKQVMLRIHKENGPETFVLRKDDQKAIRTFAQKYLAKPVS